ncbi:MAG: F0F1 ATP synthase subunit epsilon [Hyphomicrobiaceae bacterium]
MAGMFDFELVSPERVLMSDSIEHVILPGSEGQLGILAGHSPAVVALKPGLIEVLSGASVSKKIFVRGGFAEINPGTVTVLAEHALDTSTATKDELSAEIELAERKLSEAATDQARYLAQSALDSLHLL